MSHKAHLGCADGEQKGRQNEVHEAEGKSDKATQSRKPRFSRGLLSVKGAGHDARDESHGADTHEEKQPIGWVAGRGRHGGKKHPERPKAGLSITPKHGHEHAAEERQCDGSDDEARAFRSGVEEHDVGRERPENGAKQGSRMLGKVPDESPGIGNRIDVDTGVTGPAAGDPIGNGPRRSHACIGQERGRSASKRFPKRSWLKHNSVREQIPTSRQRGFARE
jgi:hypothetical protein